MNTRRTFLQQLAFGLGAAPLIGHGADADPARRVPRIGLLAGDFPVHNNAFLGELRVQGFVDGENVIVEKRIQQVFTDGPPMAKELAALPLDFIVASALPSALRVRAANPNMPMVITTCPGLVRNGFARSLELPGGIYTGVDELPPGVTEKRLTLLKAAAPAAKRVALLSTTPGVGGHETQLEEAERAAKSLGVVVQPYRATTPEELDRALGAIAGDRADAMLNFQGGLSIFLRQAIVDFATSHRLPTIYQAAMFVDAGGLMSWAPDQVEQQRMAARLAARILKGAKPGDLPIVYAPNYSLTINAGASKKIGLKLPQELLAQATRIVE